MAGKLGPYELNNIITGDAKELSQAIPDESVDIIFTDPEYDKIEDYEWLAETAARVLKPDRACLVWCGIGYLDLTIEAIKEGGLNYRWQGIMWYKNREKPLHCDMGYSQYASLLWCEKGEMKARKTIDLIGVNVFDANDLISTGGHSNHKWGKPTAAIMKWLKSFTLEGQIVFDPFTGGGTVPAVCKMLNRQCLAFEIDPETAELARQRVRNTKVPLPIKWPEQLEMAID